MSRYPIKLLPPNILALLGMHDGIEIVAVTDWLDALYVQLTSSPAGVITHTGVNVVDPTPIRLKAAVTGLGALLEILKEVCPDGTSA